MENIKMSEKEVALNMNTYEDGTVLAFDGKSYFEFSIKKENFVFISAEIIHGEIIWIVQVRP